MKNVFEVIEGISTSAKPRPEMRVINSIKNGQMIRQGDIYLIKMTERLLTVFKNVDVDKTAYTSEIKTNSMYYQLVPGSTKGSRHQVHIQEVKVFVNPTNNSPVVGPLIRASKEFDLIHPEHAHFRMPAGDYLVCYQFNPRTRGRVKD